MSKYEAMTPEQLYWYDEAHNRQHEEVSMTAEDQDMFLGLDSQINLSIKPVDIEVLQRVIQRRSKSPEGVN